MVNSADANCCQHVSFYIVEGSNNKMYYWFDCTKTTALHVVVIYAKGHGFILMRFKVTQLPFHLIFLIPWTILNLIYCQNYSSAYFHWKLLNLLPTGSEERKVLAVGSILVAILSSCQDMKSIAL